MQEEKGLILSNKKLAKDTYRMEIQASIAKDMKPGQFVKPNFPRCARRESSMCLVPLAAAIRFMRRSMRCC